MYITLKSTDSRGYYTNNTGSDFKVKLSSSIFLPSTSEIALAEIAYKSRLINIRPEEHYIHLEYKKGIYNAETWIKKNIYDRASDIYFMNYLTNEKHPLDLHLTPAVNNIKTLFFFLLSTLGTITKRRGRIMFLPVEINSTTGMCDITCTVMGNPLIVPSNYLRDLLHLPVHKEEGYLVEGKWSLDNHQLVHEWNPKREVTIQRLVLPQGHYSSVQMLLKQINEVTDSYGLSLVLTTDERVRVRYLPPSETDAKVWSNVTFSTALSTYLGFDSDVWSSKSLEYTSTTEIEKQVTSSLQADLARGMDVLWVCCNIVKSQHVGSLKKPLLRMVPLINNNNNNSSISTSSVITFSPMHFVPISLHSINTIHISIYKSLEREEPVPFDGEVIIKLYTRTS